MASKELIAKNIPADEVDEMEEAFKVLGATSVSKTENDDGTFNLDAVFPE